MSRNRSVVRTPRILLVVGVAVAILAGLVGYRALLPSAPAALEVLEGGHRGDPDEADGVIPDGANVSVFDDDAPAVANLEPDLLDAVRRAAADAERDGVAFQVTSGWRSARFQQQLVDEAVAQYGSEDEAARWVATAETSAHVSGEAIDIGPVDAMSWLSQHGGRYGLCQVYGNEPWHYELRQEAAERGCPPMFADPTEDPRLQ
ncbi:M15 family metallopeptidase [Ruania alkalisoli]|uniref:M15 family metallopeptidase n=1 Tax=Ruania alkalisoli TaxID=2779775 RepID=A0A7M1SWS1_9MICO|nr:M15 family metallopeptidase [Ruania alkalisoli]QOR71941.1 M15 family metallopeptidase [Ruania alkalisoli]